MVEFKRKKGESFENFLRRFNKGLQSSKKLIEVRGRRYLNSKKNKNQQKDAALIGMKIHEKREYLKKIGKLKEDNKRRW